MTEGKLVEAERASQRLNVELAERTKQFEALKQQFDPTLDEAAELRKRLVVKEKELKVQLSISFTSIYIVATAAVFVLAAASV